MTKRALDAMPDSGDGESEDPLVCSGFEKALRAAEAASGEAQIVRAMHDLRKLLVQSCKAMTWKQSDRSIEAWGRAHAAYADLVQAWVSQANCGALVQVVGLRSVIRLVGLRCLDFGNDSWRWFQRVVTGLCKGDVTGEVLVALDQNTGKYDDVRLWALRACRRWVKSLPERMAPGVRVLLRLTVPEAETGCIVPEGSEDYSVSKQRLILSEAWIQVLSRNGCLGLLRSEGVLDAVLAHLPEAVMPAMRQPLRLCDFFVAAFETDGMPALHGIFTLVVNYGFDYPQFYDKLVDLATPDALYANHCIKFLEIAKVALANAPKHIRRTFAERLAAAAVTAPPRAVAAALDVLANLAARCPHTRFALTQPDQMAHAHLKVLGTHYAPIVKSAVRDVLEECKPPSDLELFTYESLHAAEPELPTTAPEVDFDHDDTYKFTGYKPLFSQQDDSDPLQSDKDDPYAALTAAFTRAARRAAPSLA